MATNFTCIVPEVGSGSAGEAEYYTGWSAYVEKNNFNESSYLEQQLLDDVQTELNSLRNPPMVYSYPNSPVSLSPKTPSPEPYQCVDTNIKKPDRAKNKKHATKRIRKRKARLTHRAFASEERSGLTGGTWMLAIIPDNYPATWLTKKTYQPILNYLWDKLEATPDPVPIIDVGNIEFGVLRIICDGDYTSEWLRSLNNSTVNGVKLKVVDLKCLPKCIKMAWRTKTTQTDVSRLLNLLQRIHPSLRVNCWKIVDTLVEKITTRRIIVMDEVSADYIKSKNYSLNTGIELSTFKFLGEVEARR